MAEERRRLGRSGHDPHEATTGEAAARRAAAGREAGREAASRGRAGEERGGRGGRAAAKDAALLLPRGFPVLAQRAPVASVEAATAVSSIEQVRVPRDVAPGQAETGK